MQQMDSTFGDILNLPLDVIATITCIGVKAETLYHYTDSFWTTHTHLHGKRNLSYGQMHKDETDRAQPAQ